MKAILSAALVLGLCGLAAAADDKKADDKKGGDPVGTWKCEYTIGDMKRTADLTITKEKDALAGTMSWPDQKDVKLKDVKVKDGELTFSAVRKFMDMEFALDYKFALDGDKLKGTASADIGGQKQTFDIAATREKKKDEKKDEKKDK
jgi:hypothetical protein